MQRLYSWSGRQLAADEPQRHHRGLLRHSRQAALQGGLGVVKGDYALMADAAAEASLEGHLSES